MEALIGNALDSEKSLQQPLNPCSLYISSLVIRLLTLVPHISHSYSLSNTGGTALTPFQFTTQLAGIDSILQGHLHLLRVRRRHERVEEILRCRCGLGWGVLEVLELLAIALQGGVELLIFTLEEGHFSLSIILFLLASFQLGLSVFNLSFDVSEE